MAERPPQLGDPRREHRRALEELCGETMNENPADRDPGTCDERTPCRRRRPSLPVESSYDHGARSSCEDRPGDREEEEDVRALLEEQTEEKDEDGDTQNGEPECEYVLGRCQRLLAKR